jgi:hypothetical protein
VLVQFALLGESRLLFKHAKRRAKRQSLEKRKRRTQRRRRRGKKALNLIYLFPRAPLFTSFCIDETTRLKESTDKKVF